MGLAEQTGKYAKEDDYRPSWTLHPSGGFYVLDGYGRDYIAHYDSRGKFVGQFEVPRAASCIGVRTEA